MFGVNLIIEYMLIVNSHTKYKVQCTILASSWLMYALVNILIIFIL